MRRERQGGGEAMTLQSESDARARARRWATRLLLLAVVVSTIGCDQVSKHFATVNLMGAPRQSYFGDSVRLEYAENRGAFLSLGATLPQWGRTALFTVGTGLILLVCGIAVVRGGRPTLALVGLALVFAGGVSNLADRLTHGAVVDFLNVGVGPFRTGIFNVADMAIMAGIAWMILVRPRQERADAGGP